MNSKVLFLLLLLVFALALLEVEGKKGKGKKSSSGSSSSGSKSSKSKGKSKGKSKYSHWHSDEDETCLEEVCDKTDRILGMVEKLMNKKPCEVNIPPGSHCECAHEHQLGFLIMGRNLPRTSLTSSSNYSPDHHANRARLDADTKYPCAWTPTVSDPSPFIEVDLLEESVVFGVVIRKRCDHPYQEQYVTSYKVEANYDGIWEEIHHESQCSYMFGDADFSWFRDPIWATKFRLRPLSFELPCQNDILLVAISSFQLCKNDLPTAMPPC